MTLRPVSYTVFGIGGYEQRVEGDLGSDSGMSGGCEWEPFEIDGAEWEALRAALAADGDEPVEYVEPPAWVETPSDWHVWTMEYRFGVPAEEHRRLARVYEEIDARVRAARRSGDEAKVLELYAEHAAAGQSLSEFLNRTIRLRTWGSGP